MSKCHIVRTLMSRLIFVHQQDKGYGAKPSIIHSNLSISTALANHVIIEAKVARHVSLGSREGKSAVFKCKR